MAQVEGLPSYQKLTDLEQQSFIISQSQQYHQRQIATLQEILDKLSTAIHYAREEYKKDYAKLMEKKS